MPASNAKLIDIFKEIVAKKIASLKLDLIGYEHVARAKKDENGTATSEMEYSSKFKFEIPKRNGPLSFVQDTVKVTETIPLALETDKLQSGAYSISFLGLKISYIDQYQNIYFKATGYIITDEETGVEVARNDGQNQ